MLSGAVVCFDRIQAFLASETHSDPRLTLGKTSESKAHPQRNEQLDIAINNASIELNELHISHIAPKGSPLLVISNASFGYDHTKPPTLNNISLTLRKSQFTFIIGEVGSGKSTLMSAILGEMKPSKGSIYTSIHNMAVVSQDPWIQNLTIRQNILGNSTYDRDWYDRVLHMCALEHDIMSLPDKDATKAGSAGVSLSGGQKQRLALARAVYSKAEVILLDDVFAGQDAVTEEHVFQSLFSEQGIFREMGTTVLCITNASK